MAGRNWTFCPPLARGPPNEDNLVAMEEREGLQDSFSAGLGQVSFGQGAGAHGSSSWPPMVGYDLGWSDGSPEAEALL